MICPNCGSKNVTISIVQDHSETKKLGNGFKENVNNTARDVTALATLGVSNLFWKKSKGRQKTKYINKKVCVCQDCGNSWDLK